MSWCIKVLVKARTCDEKDEWHELRPSRHAPYRFDTKEDAEETARMCYPDTPSELVKVEEVPS